MHPRHDVPLGDCAPETANAVIEIPMGSKNKYELEEETGLLRLSRVLFSAARYPVNYGFFPRTTGSDGDALDVIVFGQEPLHPLTIVEVRPIGMLMTKAKNGREPKLLAVGTGDPAFSGMRDVAELGSRFQELVQFIADFKTLEGDPARVVGKGGAAAARKALERAAADYRKAGGRAST